MSAIPITQFWEPEQNPSASDMNAFYRDNFNWLRGSGRPGVRLALTSALAVPDTTLTFVPASSWTEMDDTDGMHNPASGVININTDGVYEFFCRVDWEGGFSSSNTTPFQWAVNIGLNNPSGSATIIANTVFEDMRIETTAAQSPSGERMAFGFTDILSLHAGDYVEMWVRQFTGATRNLRATSLPGNIRKGGASTSMGLRWAGNL